jgi:hypothetical protein
MYPFVSLEDSVKYTSQIFSLNFGLSCYFNFYKQSYKCAYYQIDYENKTSLSYLTKGVDCFDDLDVDGKKIMLIRVPVAVSSGHVDKNLICIKILTR